MHSPISFSLNNFLIICWQSSVLSFKCLNKIQSDFDVDNPNYFEYPVSLNPYDKDFILKVIGTDPQDGDAPVYVESL